MGTCRICRQKSPRISEELGLCLDCIRRRPEEALEISLGVHAWIRREWGLPAEAPRHPGGIVCDLCVNRCRIEMADSALDSGGCIKFDLKAWNETLHIALTGVTNRRTLENFARLANWIPSRPDPPLLIASTLLVTGYIDTQEVGSIAEFIVSLNPEISYSLLAFHPAYRMTDLAATSRKQARECLKAARQSGLKRVRVGNMHLLW